MKQLKSFQPQIIEVISFRSIIIKEVQVGLVK